MQISIIGAGSVGLNLGAHLACAGNDVLFIVRRKETADAIASKGVELIDPATDRRRSAAARAVVGIEAAKERLGRGPVLLCTRATETASVGAELAAARPGATVVSAQNDVDNEAVLARSLRSVIGMVVRQTCTVAADNAVLATGTGRMILGRHPRGVDDEVRQLADALEQAGFDVSLSEQIHQDKWLKLTCNLVSSPNALIRKADHETFEFVELKARLLEETRAVLLAAGIEARSCDARDRSLDAEIEYQRASLAQGTSSRSLPLYNAVWASLRYPGKGLEADAYHTRILDLARTHGLSAPTHEVVLEAVTRAWRERLGPECFGAGELFERAERGSDERQEGDDRVPIA